MFDYTNADVMRRELEDARGYFDAHLRSAAKIHRAMVGNWYREASEGNASPGLDAGGWGEGDKTPENVLFSYFAFMLPELVYQLPEARVQARRPGSHQEAAEAMEAAIRAWAANSDFMPELELAVTEAFSGWAVFKVGLEPVEQGGGAGDLRPFACRVPRDQFLCQRGAEDWRRARWQAHLYFRDLDDLQADPRLDPEATASLSEWFPDRGDAERRAHPRGETSGGRKEVRVADVYVPEARVIFTCAVNHDGGDLVYLRPPTTYWGPEGGPYVVLGFYASPGSPIPYGPLAAIMDAFQELNAHLRAAQAEAATAKTAVFVRGRKPGVADLIANSSHGGVYEVGDLQPGDIMQVELGGVTAGRMEYAQATRERFDRVLGVSDAQRGRAARATATESQIVQSNADMRTEWLRRKVLEFVKDVLGRVAWFLFNDPNVIMDLAVPDPLGGPPAGATFLGGPQPGQEDLRWSDFNLEIDPQSMQRQDDAAAQQRWLDLLDRAPALYQLVTLFPGLNARWLIDQYGAAINQPKLSELMFRDLMMLPPGTAPGMAPTPPSPMTPPGLQAAGAGMPFGKPNPAAHAGVGQGETKAAPPFGVGAQNPMAAGGMMPGGPTPVQRNPALLGAF